MSSKLSKAVDKGKLLVVGGVLLSIIFFSKLFEYIPFLSESPYAGSGHFFIPLDEEISGVQEQQKN